MLKSEDVFWTADQIILQQWLALPKRERKPKTLGLLASSLGIEQNTFTRWKQLDGFMDEVKKMIRGELDDDSADIYGALRKEAKAGSFQHIKLALELNGDYIQKQEVAGKLQIEYVNDWRGVPQDASVAPSRAE